ncbi:MAG: hypothetical protein KIT69_11005 [Propionibacteriaceae bacterium]|nr:hypothetical protein [Propionibacteriaceae bacterium]
MGRPATTMAVPDPMVVPAVTVIPATAVIPAEAGIWSVAMAESQPEAGHRRRQFLWALSGLAVAVHLVALYLPGAPEPGFDLPGADKVVHVLLFAVPVWLLGRLTGRVGLVAAIFAVHAVASELVQHWFLPHRTGDPLDLLADLVGISSALLASRFTRGERADRPAAGQDPPDGPAS